MSQEYSLLSFNAIVNRIAKIIMSDWEEPDNDDKNWFPGLNSWIYKQTAKALNHRIHDQWERLLDRIDDKVLDVHRACYHHLFKQPDIIRDKRLYKYDKLVKDLQDYGACAVALDKMDYLGKEFCSNFNDSEARRRTLNGRNWDALDDKLNIIQDYWRQFFSDTGELYEELNKTIENLPGNLSSQSIIQLPEVHLQRPITNRLEFIFVMSAVDQFESDLSQTFMFATEDEIKEAIDLYNKYKLEGMVYDWREHTEIGYGKTVSIKQFTKFIIHNSDNHTKDIVTIVDKIKDEALIEKI